MEKEVVISIKGMQTYEGTPPDIIELVTEGRLVRDGGGYTLSYQESELTGLEGTLNTRQLLADLNDQGGDIEVDYSVEVDHALAGRNIFRISVKEAEGGLGSLKQ